jgi:hypothetical protein
MHAGIARDRRPQLRVEVGTLWRMEREPHVARCVLVWEPRVWELRVYVNGAALLTERCRTHAQVVTTADAWRGRLRLCGWTAVSAAGKTIGIVGEEGIDAKAVEKMGHLLADVLARRQAGGTEGIRRDGQAGGVGSRRQRRVLQEQ